MRIGSGRRGLKLGELHADRGPAFAGSAGRNRPAMSLGDRLDNRQTESGATGDSVAGVVGSVEALKDAVTMLLGDPRSVVAHDERDTAAMLAASAQSHQSVRRLGVCDCVVDEVAQSLRQSVRIGVQDPGGNGIELKSTVLTTSGRRP